MKRSGEIIAIDTGQGIVGIFSAKTRGYTCYRGSTISKGIELIIAAAEVITYNGNNADLLDLGEFAGHARKPLCIEGIHTDMRQICWSDRIWGSSLHKTYLMHFSKLPDFEDSHEGCNRLDTILTFKLWQLWRNGKLKVLDGNTT